MVINPVDILWPRPQPAVAPPKPSLLDYDLAELEAILSAEGQAPYRARQLFSALHQRRITDWELKRGFEQY